MRQIKEFAAHVNAAKAGVVEALFEVPFDDLGFLWVLRAPVGDDEGVLIEVDGPDGSPMGTIRISSGLHDVFRPDGRYLGTVKMPHGLDKVEIGPDYVLGVTRDDLGVEFVRMFRLDRGGREPEAGVEE